jgi:hypothetical protein
LIDAPGLPLPSAQSLQHLLAQTKISIQKIIPVIDENIIVIQEVVLISYSRTSLNDAGWI